MSAQQKERFDLFYKGFMVVTVSIIGFFCVRLTNSIDKATEDIQTLKTSSAVMQNDMTNFKESWKSFITIVNNNQREAESKK